jgi:hypothetical protein
MHGMQPIIVNKHYINKQKVPSQGFLITRMWLVILWAKVRHEASCSVREEISESSDSDQGKPRVLFCLKLINVHKHGVPSLLTH